MNVKLRLTLVQNTERSPLPHYLKSPSVIQKHICSYLRLLARKDLDYPVFCPILAKFCKDDKRNKVSR